MSYLKGKSMSDLRKDNSAKIIEIVLKLGPLSRSEISNISGLTKASVSTITRQLIDEGLLEETGFQEDNKSVGRKRKNMDIVSEAKYVIGVEIGVKTIKSGIIDLKGNLLKELKISLNTKSETVIINKTIDLIKKISVNFEKNDILGVGIGATGIIDNNKGIVIKSPNLNWNNISLKKEIEKQIALPILIDNNVRLMALGENRFCYNWGEIPRMLFIHAGYGIGCGIILNGELYYGYKFGAGELGHTIVMPDGPTCTCGKNGCLEAFSSGHAIISNYEEAKANNKNYLSEINNIIIEDKNGINYTNKIMAKAGKYMGISISNLLNVLAPDLVILHGELFDSDSYYSNVEDYLKSNFFGVNDKIPIKRSKMNERAAVLGAGALIIDRILLKK